MRIALAVPHLGVSGGLGVYCRSLLTALLAQPEDDELHLFYPEDPRQLFAHAGIDDTWQPLVKHPRVRLAPLDWPADQPLSLPMDRLLGGPVAAIRPDIFHSTFYTGFEKTPCRQVITYHDAGFLDSPQVFGETGRQRRATVDRVLPATDRLICISGDARERICRLLPFDPARADIVYHSITDSPEAMEAARRPEAARQPLWPGGDTVADWGRYLFVPVGAGTGFNRVRKNIPTAVNAFRLARPAGVKMIIAGTSVLHPKMLAELLPESELAAGRMVGDAWRSGDDAIRLLPALERDTFLAGMARTTAIVYPSRYEGFGLPTIEAFAMGVPVIGARATSIPEIAGDAALLVDPDDTAGFAAAMKRILAEPALAADLVARGRERVKLFTVDNLGRRTRDVYLRALGKA